MANVAAVNCGEVIEPGAKFCVKCGTRIDDEEQKPAGAGDSGASEIGDSCSVGLEILALRRLEIPVLRGLEILALRRLEILVPRGLEILLRKRKVLQELVALQGLKQKKFRID